MRKFLKVIRRLIAFIIMLPAWPLAFVAAIIDDEAEPLEIISGVKMLWKKIYEE